MRVIGYYVAMLQKTTTVEKQSEGTCADLHVTVFHFNCYRHNRFNSIVQGQFLHIYLEFVEDFVHFLSTLFASFRVSLLFFACFIVRQVKNTSSVTLKYNSMTCSTKKVGEDTCQI